MTGTTTAAPVKMTDALLLGLLEDHTPREIALLFLTDTETVEALTGLDAAWWFAGVDECSGTVAFFRVDPGTHAPVGAIICVAEAEGAGEDEWRARIGDLGYPYVVRLPR